jgi:hypothetical protein
MFLDAADTQWLVGSSLWSRRLPRDLTNAHNEFLSAREKAAINCKINNSNFELLDETKDLHASPASIERIKKQKSAKHSNARTPFPRLPGLLALMALLAHFFSTGSQDEPC